MLTTYVDDSGSEPGSPIYILGSLCLPKPLWKRVSEEWGGVLSATPSVGYFKASEVWERNEKKASPFVKLTTEERVAKVSALVDVLSRHDPLTASFQIEWPVFLRFTKTYSLPKGMDNPYFYLYYGAILLQSEWGIRVGNPTAVDFVFDNHGSIGDEVKAWYPTFKSSCSPEIKDRLGSDPKFCDEKVVIPLQAADLFAWYARRNALNALSNDWHKNVWDTLSTHHSVGTIDMDNLIAIGNMLGIL
jgi:hypothetical protein